MASIMRISSAGVEAFPAGRVDLTRRRFLLLGAATASLTLLSGCARPVPAAPPGPPEHFEVSHTDDEWRQRLSPEQYEVLRQGGTEGPFTSPLDGEHRNGVFGCGGCGLELFSSATKFDSGTGWPSFWRPLENAILQRPDSGLGMARTEVRCRRCGGHLGHVFNDGPAPTGLRYCINGVALTFRPA